MLKKIAGFCASISFDKISSILGLSEDILSECFCKNEVI